MHAKISGNMYLKERNSNQKRKFEKKLIATKVMDVLAIFKTNVNDPHKYLSRHKLKTPTIVTETKEKIISIFKIYFFPEN